jgi:hypothetical protein
VTGLELVAGAAVGYLVRKARRIGRRADADVDLALDAGMDALHRVVSEALKGDSSLTTLEEQAQAGSDTDRTRRRVQLAIEQAAEDDTSFADQLGELVSRLQKLETTRTDVITAIEGGIAAGGDVIQHAETGGVIARDISGPVNTTGNPSLPGPNLT